MGQDLGTFTPLAMEERFWMKVMKSDGDGCWEWLGKIHDHGYGLFSAHSRVLRAHRVAWEFENGPIPAGHVVRHRCDNRKCVRIDHLLIGMQGHNMDDALNRKRITKRLGEQVASAKLNPEKVRWIRNQHAAGMPKATMARSLNVSSTTVNSVLAGITWSHI